MSSKTKGSYIPTLIIHGGAGNITRANLPPALYAQYHASLLKYLTSTHDLLVQEGADAVTAACHAVALMEDDPLFNCGRGSVFNSDGSIEMEASLMVSSIHDDFVSVNLPNSITDRADSFSKSPVIGQVKKTAAVSMIMHTRHPILLAREVLSMADSKGDDSQAPSVGEMHGHLSGQWVEDWGFKERGLERKSRQWFWTRKRWEEHRRGLGLDTSDRAWLQKIGRGTDGFKAELGDDSEEPDLVKDWSNSPITQTDEVIEVPSQGTVGAVCMDSWGNLCVATSTGGLTNKKPGRIGDTPTVGAGYWAESWKDSLQEIAQFQPTDPPVGVAALTGVLQAIREATQSCIEACIPFPLPGLRPRTSSRYQLAQITTNNMIKPCQPQENGHETKLERHALLSRDNSAANGTNFRGNKNTDRMSRQAMKTRRTVRRAVAMSGTGNGDSFLRTNAVRTAAAITRFSAPAASRLPLLRSRTLSPLQYGVSRVAGPGGELQLSAGNRWGRTGEGQGGIIGVELLLNEEEEEHDSGGNDEIDDDLTHGPSYKDEPCFLKQELPRGREATRSAKTRRYKLHASSNIVFDFNCGGMWRAYFDRTEHGELTPKIMVFKEDY